MNRTLSSDGHTERNYGIDALRIVAMIMIPILHIIGHGGILSTVTSFSINYDVVWLIKAAACCAVNCYGLISGYVGYGRKFRYSNIIYLCCQVAFYTLIITGIFAVFVPGSVGIKTIIRAVFPFASGPYWYFNSYFCMFFFIPFFNMLLEKTEKLWLDRLIFTILLIFSVIPTLVQTDMTKADYGFSPIWLALLYMTGGYIKKYNIADKLKQWQKILGYFCCVFAGWLIEFGITYFMGASDNRSYFLEYTSPAVLMSAVFLLLFFAKLKVNGFWIKFIGFFAPLSFSVYLIHDELLIREQFITNSFIGYATMNPVLMFLSIISTALAIWLVCSLIDKIRLTIFNALKIKKLCVWTERFIAEKINRIIKHQ